MKLIDGTSIKQIDIYIYIGAHIQICSWAEKILRSH